MSSALLTRKSTLANVKLRSSSQIESEQLLGSGTQSRVYRISYKNQPAVLKQLIKTKADSIEPALNEINTLTRVSNQPDCHPSIVCIYDYWYDAKNNGINIVEEYIPGTDLSHYLKTNKLTAEDMRSILHILIEAIEYLHSHDVVHRDIKLANVMITPEKQIKLVDFGIACYDDECPVRLAGTPNYIAPELWHLLGELITSSRTTLLTKSQWLQIFKGADIFALGILGYYLLNGKMPFTTTSLETLKQNITSEDPIISESGNEELDELVNLMLAKDISSRPSAGDLLKYMQ